MTKPVKVRIAPSPTGAPHVGTAYIALFNYCFARKHNGSFILRIEDTDQSRSRPVFETAIMDALNWVGLEWDEGPDVGGPNGPYRQSERTEIYRKHAQKLLESGNAYPCFCTEERLAEMRALQEQGAVRTGYDRKCRTLSEDEVKEKMAAGEPYVVRLAMPVDGETVFKDRLRSKLIRWENAQIDDQILLKADGYPTYHLANVVDDHLMGITHVIRAEEWISSTPKHVQLYKAFGWEPPEWIHMPLLRNKDRSKISKRYNPTSLLYYKEAGILPEALRNYLGLMGYSFPGDDEREKFSLAEMVASFDIDNVSTSGPIFDLEKLDWMNGLYIRDLGPEGLWKAVREWGLSEDRLEAVTHLVFERMRRLDEFVPQMAFLHGGTPDYRPVLDGLIPHKKKRKPSRSIEETATMFDDLLSAIDASQGDVKWTSDELGGLLGSFYKEYGWSGREFYMPLRVATTGDTETPPLTECLEQLGREQTRWRIRAAVNFLSELPTPHFLKQGKHRSKRWFDWIRETVDWTELRALTDEPELAEDWVRARLASRLHELAAYSKATRLSIEGNHYDYVLEDGETVRMLIRPVFSADKDALWSDAKPILSDVSSFHPGGIEAGAMLFVIGGDVVNKLKGGFWREAAPMTGLPGKVGDLFLEERLKGGLLLAAWAGSYRCPEAETATA